MCVRVVVLTGLLVGFGVAATAAPAGAVVHEIVGQWCADRGELGPPGIIDMSKPNFAKPVLANGVVTVDGGVITVNTDHPASKVVVVGQTTEGIPIVEPDPSHPFTNCRALRD